MENNTTYKHCLNCQTELIGEYCHVCGQHASRTKPTIKEFILEYLNIAFVWDTRFFKTIWSMIRKPGHVTNEYMAGKVRKYMHPLKLNMFLLFAFVTLFLLFHRDFGSSLKSVTRDEVNYPLIQMGLLTENPAYAERLKASPLDTVHLSAPLFLAEAYSEFVTDIDATETSGTDSVAVWRASLPHLLIEDEVIILHDDGYYYFASSNNSGILGVNFLEDVWSQMVEFATKYFPMTILLTVPFLSFLLGVFLRRKQCSRFKHFIFSLHFTAILELSIIVLYLLHLSVSPPAWVMQWILILGSCSYMALAIRRVYEIKKWHNAVLLSILTNIGYASILFAIFSFLVIIAIFVAIFQM